jgi:pyrroloquinoline quinone (PQQ) biosynthesis protein C
MSETDVIARLDRVVHEFVLRCRYFHQPLTRGRAKSFVKQHWKNTRHRNSVLKLRVATNVPDWDLRLRIIAACAEEIIADETHGGGRAHWLILEELGCRIGMTREEIRAAPVEPSQEMCWATWDGLMSNRHWLEGLVANTCAERINVPGYGEGAFRAKGWFGIEQERWGKLFGLTSEELGFFALHSEADLEHSNLGWHAVAGHAARLSMEEAVVEACRKNFVVWEHHLDGIAAAGDREERRAAA